MALPLGYFLSWSTSGTYPAGDDWGNMEDDTKVDYPVPNLEPTSRIPEPPAAEPVTLDADQCETVTDVIREQCDGRNWTLHALAVGSKRVRVVVTAPDVAPELVMDLLKMYSLRRLNAEIAHLGGGLRRWWSRDGSKRVINDEGNLHNAIRHVVDKQSNTNHENTKVRKDETLQPLN